MAKGVGYGIIVFFLVAHGVATAFDDTMVMHLDGAAVLLMGESRPQPVQVADFLHEGDRIRLAEGAKLVLIYSGSGTREEIAGPGTIRVGEAGSEVEAKPALVKSSEAAFPSKGALELARYAATTLRAKPFRGEKTANSGDGSRTGPDTIRILNLCDTTIRSTRPEFRWRPVEGAEKYLVRIFDERDEMVFETTTARASLAYDGTTLDHGKEYLWTVSAHVGGRMVAKRDGWFFVLEEERIKALKKTERAVGARFSENDPEGLLSLAMICQEYNLRDEAAEMVAKLRAHYPDNEKFVNWERSIRCK